MAGDLAMIKPLRKSERLCLNGEIVAELERLGDELLESQRGAKGGDSLSDPVPDIRRRIEELSERAKEFEVEYVFQAIGRPAWRKLISECPPNKEQKAAGGDVNGDRFRPAAMAASCISHEDATPEAFLELEAKLTDGQWDRLWFACRAANMGTGDLPNFDAAFGTARPSETSS